MNILSELLKLKDSKYKEFNKKLVPNVEHIGIAIPVLRKFANNIIKENPLETKMFIENLPHKYLEENHLHGFILEKITDINKLLEKTEIFLPYINNWQTCDSFLPKIFKKEREYIPYYINKWLNSNNEFVIRYAIRLKLYRKNFSKKDILEIMNIGKSEKYYVYMAAAWYLSMVAKNNKYDFDICFNLKNMNINLMNCTCKKIRESKQFSKEEKEKYKKIKDSVVQ